MAESARQAKADETRSTVRASEPARATVARSALDGRRSTLLSKRTIQPSLRVSQPSDAAEVEADRVAKAVVSMPAPAPDATHRSAPMLHRAAAPTAKKGTKAASGGADPDVEKEVRKAATGGAALPAKVRKTLEPRFRANFAGVRIHTDGNAAKLSAKLGARAFAFGNHIFFGGGAYDPNSKGGMELLAHELTHTIQQGETIQRKADDSADTRVTQRTERQASRLGLSDALNFFADAANAIPGYRMFTILIGVNPINMSAVEASAANILRAIVEFLPGGNVITRVLDSYGIFDKVGGWIEGQLKSLGISGASIKAAIDKFLESLSWKDIFNLGGVWDRAKSIFTDPISKIISFAKSLFSEILRMVREAVLRPLAALAEGSAGYPLLKVVIGFDPVTGEAVEPTAEAVIGGLLTLVGQQELWANIQRAKAIPRAWAWFKGAMGGIKALVSSIPSRFIAALKGLEIMDFVVLPSAFIKLAKVFGNFMGDFGSWALGTVIDLLKIIVEVVAPGAMPYIAKAGAAFNKILKNPVGFVQTLVRAGKLGLTQFAGNFLTHLKASLIGWLTGAMGGAGVYIPQGFSLSELLKFVLSVLGLTWAHLRPRLVALSNETVVKGLEEGFALVKTLVKEGPAAAWQQIVETLSNLKDMVIDQVMAFVKGKIVEVAISKLAMMLSPAGALIQAIVSIYNTVMFFIERLQQIAQVAASFIDSIATIAAGNVGPAANRVEKTMAGLLTLVISFLARFAGLGKVSTVVNNLIAKVRAPVFKAFDRVAGWIIAQAKKLGKLLVDKATGKANRTEADIKRDVERTKRELPGKIDAFLAGEPSKVRVRAQLMIWKLQYKLSDLQLLEAGEEGKFSATVNPTFAVGGGVRIYVGDAELIALIHDLCKTTLQKHPKMRQARAEMRVEVATQTAAQTAAGTTGSLPINAPRARDRLAIATMLPSNRKMNEIPADITVNIGKDSAGQDVQVQWKRLAKQEDPNRVIQPPGQMGRRYLNDAGTGIIDSLPQGSSTGRTVSGMKALATGQPIPANAGDAQTHGELDVLTLGQEVARHRENFAFAVMTRDLMEQRALGLKTAGQSLPAQPTGAKRAQEALLEGAQGGDLKAPGRAIVAEAEARAVVQETKKTPNPKAAKNARDTAQTEVKTIEEIRKRAVNLLTSWIKARLKSDAPVTKTKDKFLAWARKVIRKRLSDFINTGE
jgi:hypothetical protein